MEEISSGHHASACHSTNVSDQEVAGPIAHVLASIRVEGMAWVAVEKHDANVLDSAVREKQFDAHRSNFRLLGILQHAFNPIRSDDLGVIIEEEQVIAFGLGGAQVHL